MIDKVKSELSMLSCADYTINEMWLPRTTCSLLTLLPQRSTRAIHGAHYTTYVHLERHTRIRAPAASHRRLNPQHSDAPHYIRTRSYVYFHYKHIACTTCPIPLIMIHTSQIPATRRGCRSRDLKISGRRRARRDHASDVAEIMSGRYCEGVVLQDEGEAGPGRE
jgi:hypothetical protein